MEKEDIDSFFHHHSPTREPLRDEGVLERPIHQLSWFGGNYVCQGKEVFENTEIFGGKTRDMGIEQSNKPY